MHVHKHIGMVQTKVSYVIVITSFFLFIKRDTRLVLSDLEKSHPSSFQTSNILLLYPSNLPQGHEKGDLAMNYRGHIIFNIQFPISKSLTSCQ